MPFYLWIRGHVFGNGIWVVGGLAVFIFSSDKWIEVDCLMLANVIKITKKIP